MFVFVKTHSRPELSRLTRAYECLSTAVQEATEAIGQARRARNELDGAVESKHRDQRVTQQRAAAYSSALVREQAAREPLTDSMTELQSAVTAMPQGACKATEGWGFWEIDAMGINLICSKQLMERSIAVGARFRPYAFPIDTHFVLCSEYKQDQLDEALTWMEDLPLLSSDNPLQKSAQWNFLLRCLHLCAETGHCSVSINQVPADTADRTTHLLRKAGWLASQVRQGGDLVLAISRPGAKAKPLSVPVPTNAATGKPRLNGYMFPSSSSDEWLTSRGKVDAATGKKQTITELGKSAATDCAYSQEDLDAGVIIEIERPLYRIYVRAYEEAIMERNAT